ncbi:hypothetical protein [Cellulomonas xiejunii]|uniref:hypothetical protein n=1 Tax=Cellulomonas xiejunii TaxID=2968083 RepID=UPI001D0E4D99|nr:hypothetical protein [Cellulomonas xiejunii]MCC2314539.1 hypothetical protein [Cellulomonas xiejunii]MCC2322746.1 hypothetical protein [Cellulomonas xiejunii]
MLWHAPTLTCFDRTTISPVEQSVIFARVLRYRDDKTAAEADTIHTVRSYVT